MNQSYPVPPPELVEQWIKDCDNPEQEYEQDIATLAAQWGADQELDACCEWLAYEGHEHEHLALRANRRPKPPSLKEQALDALREAESTGCLYVNGRGDTIRRALEALDD